MLACKSNWWLKLFVFCLSLFSIETFANPVAGFNTSIQSGCSPLLVNFTNTSTGNSPTYFWDFGNGNTSTLTHPSASFITPGTYQVTLTATDASGSHSTTKPITVFANPVANFTSAAFPGGCRNDTICFRDISVNGSGDINSWSWDFGDGNSSNLRNPCTQYTFTDTFKVTLVVRDVNGCQSTQIKPDFVTITEPFKVNFWQNKTLACQPPLTVQFSDSTTPASSGYTYSWDFGNGGSSSSPNPAVIFTTGGAYSVSLSVTNSAGCAVKLTKSNLISVVVPKADFDPNTISGCAPFNVLLKNTSFTANQSLLAYSWTTSNNLTSSLKDPTFLFQSPGTYSVSLKAITNLSGCLDSVGKTNFIRVFPKPVAMPTSDNYLHCKIPATVQLTPNDANGNAYWWDFGDNTSSTQKYPIKAYTKAGVYIPRLTITSTNGCKDSFLFQSPIRVKPSGFVLIDYFPDPCKPRRVHLAAIDTSLIPITHWKWVLNGITVAIDTNQYRDLYTDTGIYHLVVYGWNDEGCGDTIEYVISVGQKFNLPDSVTYDTLACQSSTFRKADSLSASKWIWDFGDGTHGSASGQITHRYREIGYFWPSLSINHYGCVSNVPLDKPVHITGPFSNFDITASICANDPVYFINRSQGNNNHYFWTFGDGQTSTSANPMHAYAESGTYQVTLFAIDSITMCTDTISKTVIRPALPKLGFTLKDTVGCQTLKVICKDTSLSFGNDFVNWQWSYASYPPSAFGPDTVLTINRQGYSSVKLKITDSKGCIFTIIKDSAVHIYKGNAALSVFPSAGCVPLNTMATDNSQLENGIRSRRLIWGSGDTTYSTSTTDSYTYLKAPQDQQAGFTIKYSVTDSAGCTFNSTKVVKPYKPKADFIYTLFKTCGKDSVSFFTYQTALFGIPPLTNTWNIGGTISNLNNPNKVFQLGDTIIDIRLVKRDGMGCFDTLIQSLHSNTNTPVAGFYANPLKINCPGPPVFLYDTSVAGASPILSYTWNLGDGSKSGLKNPAKIYLVPGTYDLRLSIKDSLNCTSTIDKPGYVVIGGPIASYSYTPKNGCTPLEVTFQSISSNASKIEWDLGDGYIDTLNSLKHVYDRPNQRGKSYKPNLTITDSAGCKRGLLDPDSIVVYPLPVAGFNVVDQMICLGNVVNFTNTTMHDIPLLRYHWRFGDGKSQTDDAPFNMQFAYTYDSLGSYTIALTAEDTLHCRDSSIKEAFIQVIYDTVPPAKPDLLRATVLNNSQVQMEFKPSQDHDWKSYTLQYDYIGTWPTMFKELYQRHDTVYVQNDLNTLQQVYSYSVFATDVCKNVSEPSEIHTTVELKASAIDNAVQLNWTPYMGWDSIHQYDIYRLSDSDMLYHFIGTVPGNTRAYIDSGVMCFKTYYYKILAIEQGVANQYSWSDSSGAQPRFLPTVPATRNIRATVLNNRYVLVQWRRKLHKYAYSYLIYRAIDDQPPVFFKEISNGDTALMDTDVEVDQHSYTYLTYLKDQCGGIGTASNKAKTMVLQTSLQENDILLYDPLINWSNYAHWHSGIDHYSLLFKNNETGTYEEIARKQSGDTLRHYHKNIAAVQRYYCYKAIAFQQDSLDIFSESNEVCVSTAPRLYAPNVFTINGDNLNEQFVLGGIFLDTYQLKVYNRYGELVFESHDIHHSWDGTHKGLPCASDVYVYMAEGTGWQGQQISLTGNVTLLR